MTQRVLELFEGDALPGDTEALIGRFKEACRRYGKAPSTIAAEVLQLRSVARDAKTHLGMALEELILQPHKAAQLIELRDAPAGALPCSRGPEPYRGWLCYSWVRARGEAG